MSTHAATIARACRLIESEPETPSLAGLAAEARLSPWHFHRVFKEHTGVTPKEYAAAHRARRARETLPASRTVTDAIYAAGFGSSGRFYEAAAGMLGMTPTQYRAGGLATEIKVATGRCSLGVALVGATDKGVCAIFFGDAAAPLRDDLERRFPRARFVRGDAAFEALVARVLAVVDEPARGLELPLDVRGTAFQHRVWRALREIPAGTTATYTEIARKIGAPKAVRAVAARRPASIAIPCHRVVREDGELAGYRWGIDRKRALLAREGAKGLK